ncbi:MAG: polymer-forming cytoskeletal protein, partial [Paracoccaceae bacterium]
MINVDDSFTVLGTNVTFEANIKSKSGIAIIGTLQGDVDATEISASAGSHVNGDITAGVAELHGSV